jgi:hypothetical protein
MIYNDGYETDENLRFIKCPRCGNEEYSSDAKYCRICGFPAYNECEGSPDYDEYGNNQGFYTHRNAGNARYCEYCGKPTMLFKEKYLKAFNEVNVAAPAEEEVFPFDLDGEMPF